MHADRSNRVILALVGLIALVLGAGALLAGFGVFGSDFRHRQLADNAFSRYVGQHGNWLWPVIAVGAAILGLLALVWLLRLTFSTDRAGDIAISRSPQDRQVSKGKTTLSSSALTSALVAELESYHGVTAASARLIGEAQKPTVVVKLSVGRQTDPIELVRRVEAEAIAQARQALQVDDLPVQIDLTVSDKKTARASSQL